MAVETTFNRATYVGNTAGTIYPFAAKVFALTDVLVYIKDTLTGDAVGPLEQGAGAGECQIVAISGNLDNGVNVTTTDSYLSTDRITLVRDVAETQNLNLEEGGDLPANELEDALDRGVILTQQLSDDGGRHLSHPATDPLDLSYEAPTVEKRAGLICAWDSEGNVTAVSVAEGGIIGADESKGLEVSGGGIISGKVDESSLTFTGGNFAVKDGGIDTTQLADDAVDTDKLADGSVTDAKLGSDIGVWNSWTPVVTQGTATPTFNASKARYSKIGKTISAVGYITFTQAATGQAGSQINVSGLPTGVEGTGYCSGIYLDTGDAVYNITSNGAIASLQFYVGEPSGVLGEDPSIEIAVGDSLRFSITYEAA